MTAEPKMGRGKDGMEMHYSVGALIKQGDKYLLIDRAKPPFGFAGVAGHVDEGESPENALMREVGEESGYRVESHRLIAQEELDWNWCRRGVGSHYWYLYECDVSGEIKQNILETKSIGWFTKEEISKLKLEPVWEYWFRKLGVLK